MTAERVTTTSSAAASRRGDEIRQAAGALFLAKGYAATTMNDIAAAVGILPGSLYHHFKSKEAVAAEILEAFNAELQELASRLRRSGHRDLPAEQRLRELTREIVLLGQHHAAAVRLRIFEPPSSAGERFHSAVKFYPASLVRLWNAAANDLSAAISGSRLDPPMLTRALQTLASTMAASLPASASPQDSAAVICDALLYGIAVDCPPDLDLDTSRPMAAAKEAVARWHEPLVEDELKAQIIAAARAEFARRGYDATTIRDIAEASGVRMGTIYRRVNSMEEILEEITINYAAHLDDAIRAVLTAEPEAAAATLDAVSYVVVQAHRHFPDETRMMSLSWSRPQQKQPAVQVSYREQVTDRMTLLTGVLADGERGGDLRLPASPEAFAPRLRSILWTRFAARENGRYSKVQPFMRNHLLRGVLPRS
ncbi:helix-turn-helix domain-containing protein [Actinoplanes sp. NPDC051851]|uniref:TetR/AcrR family transcriptional regulator n=1 Tax=Actinoplanes sp. NPDC051851 TaxID=3154753 RepID=UPI003424BDEE